MSSGASELAPVGDTGEGDAFGRLLLAHQNGEQVYEIIERDDGYIDVASDVERYFSPPEGWPDHQLRALENVRGPKVMDIGCGAGRVALYLQKQGFQVTGVDSSPGAVKVCRRRGLKDTQQLSITRLSRRMGTFHSLLLLGNNFGLMGNAGRTRWLLRRFFHMTAPEGLILAESLDPHQTDSAVHLSYHRRNLRRGRMAGQVRLRVRYQRLRTPWFDYLFVSPDEMRNLIDDTGWRVSAVVQSNSPVYVAVLKKGNRVGS